MKNFLLVALTILTCYSFAQSKTEKAKITWGEEFKVSKKNVLSDILGSDESGFYALRTEIRWKGGLIFEHYNREMNLTQSVEFKLDKGHFLVEVLFLNDEFKILSSKIDKDEKVNVLYVQTLDKKSFGTKGSMKQIASIDYSDFNKRNSGSFSYIISRNKSKILIYYALPYEKKTSDNVGMAVFDTDFNMLWEKIADLPYEEELFDVTDFDITDKGEVYMLSKLYKDKAKNTRKGKPNYDFLVLNYTRSSTKAREFNVQIEGKYLTDMSITVNENNDIICAGFYSENGTYSVEGSYFLKINGKTKSIETRNFEKFGIDFITQNLTEKQEKKAKKRESKGKSNELYRYDLDKIILKEDGGAILVGEQYFVREHTTTVSNGNGGVSTRTTYHYYYNDIIVINFDAKGEMIWTEKIAKRQHTVNDNGYYSSYVLSVVDDRLFFIFNDHPKNLLELKGNKLSNFRGGKNSMVVLVEVDSDGRQVKEALYSTKDEATFTRPKVCKQINNNELILFAIRRKSNKFGLVEFQK